MPSTILCIDDRPEVLALRKANLETQGYSVMVASSGYDGIKILQNRSVDAVLVEFKEEGLDAEAVAFLIKGRFPDLPIILLSAYAEMSERILWLVDEYVMKSAPLAELRRIIERATRPALRKPLQSTSLLRTFRNSLRCCPIAAPGLCVSMKLSPHDIGNLKQINQPPCLCQPRALSCAHSLESAKPQQYLRQSSREVAGVVRGCGRT